MSYTKTTWVTGDTVTASKLNNAEDGIFNNDAAISTLQTKVDKYDGLVYVKKITSASTTMGDVNTILTNAATAGDQIVFDVSALGENVKVCSVVIANGNYRIADIETGLLAEGTYAGTDLLKTVLSSADTFPMTLLGLSVVDGAINITYTE